VRGVLHLVLKSSVTLPLFRNRDERLFFKPVERAEDNLAASFLVALSILDFTDCRSSTSSTWDFARESNFADSPEVGLDAQLSCLPRTFSTLEKGPLLKDPLSSLVSAAAPLHWREY
jgi:hypothetical protein